MHRRQRPRKNAKTEEFIPKERTRRNHSQGSMPVPEFKTTIIKILGWLEKSIEDTKEIGRASCRERVCLYV